MARHSQTNSNHPPPPPASHPPCDLTNNTRHVNTSLSLSLAGSFPPLHLNLSTPFPSPPCISLSLLPLLLLLRRRGVDSPGRAEVPRHPGCW
ncbi:hypothetical protein NL676_020639 [Syzygium grande]|nr:hypothetical protein NL676_020639 [Syzygium grande]